MVSYAPGVDEPGDDGVGGWSYLPYPEDKRNDMRWALFPFSIIRGIIAWVTGKDPVTERRQRRLAEDQTRSATELAEAEKEAYRHLGHDHPSS
jgi:hypothetical protein